VTALRRKAGLLGPRTRRRQRLAGLTMPLMMASGTAPDRAGLRGRPLRHMRTGEVERQLGLAARALTNWTSQIGRNFSHELALSQTKSDATTVLRFQFMRFT